MDVLQYRRPVLAAIFAGEGLKETAWVPRQRNYTLLWSTVALTPYKWPTAGSERSSLRKMNHFPTNNHLAVKAKLYENFMELQQQHPILFDFVPETYLLPMDDFKLSALFAPLQPCDCPLIQKPKAAARGEGISLAASVTDVINTPEYLLQHYVEPVHLIRDRKYHLRLYVLVTSLEPLRVYVHNEGYIKLARTAYTRPTCGDEGSRVFDMHITNHQEGMTYDFGDPFEHSDNLFALLGDQANTVREKIDRMLALMVAGVADKMIQQCRARTLLEHCFELFGVSPYLKQIIF